MKLKNLLMALTVGLFLFSFTGCDNGTTVKIVSPTWSTVNGWKSFETNDKDYYNYGFNYTFYNTENLFPIGIELKKISGAAGGGYGVILCKSTTTNNMSRIVILISTYGNYKVYELNATGVFNLIRNWTQPVLPGLNIGFNVSNTIAVSQSGSDYTITFNGNTAESSFTSTYGLQSGLSGFYATTSTEADGENFPDAPVEIMFKMTDPMVNP